MKTYIINEIRGKYQGEIFIINAENAVEAMKKVGMTCWVRAFEKAEKAYFGKSYEVYEIDKAWHVEYICHR